MHWATIAHIIWEIGYWPGGIIVGNLIANLVWEPSRATVAKFQLKRQTENLKQHTDTKLDEHHDRTKAALDEHHEKILKVVNGNV